MNTTSQPDSSRPSLESLLARVGNEGTDQDLGVLIKTLILTGNINEDRQLLPTSNSLFLCSILSKVCESHMTQHGLDMLDDSGYAACVAEAMGYVVHLNRPQLIVEMVAVAFQLKWAEPTFAAAVLIKIGGTALEQIQ